MLSKMNWRLADATPRRLALDSGFMLSLRQELGIKGLVDPGLAELHASLGNSSHVQRIINDERRVYWPHGTGLKSALKLYLKYLTY